ncbi:hypothetical protein [Mycolicibacterium peregrinum]|uniref:hypothetical protein n=1 Tax=Mycolicibacterium peregrinum TaxID=43304 RepID=UPI003AAF168A
MASEISVQDLATRFAPAIAAGGGSLLAFIVAGVTSVELFTLLGVCLLVAAVILAVRVAQGPAVPAVVSTVPVPDAVRQQRLQEFLAVDVARTRGRIESVTPYSAVVVSGQRVNHILHLLVSVLLCGLWLPVWLILGLSGGERRSVITVDQCGNVTRA